jgi:hypothetical protein
MWWFYYVLATFAGKTDKNKAKEKPLQGCTITDFQAFCKGKPPRLIQICLIYNI